MSQTTYPPTHPVDRARDTVPWDGAIVAAPGGAHPAHAAPDAAASAGLPGATDAELDLVIERARGRDERALGELYQRFSPEIYRYFHRNTRDHELAADLTNHVFVRVIEAIDKGNTWHQSFPGWLHRIARNLLIDNLRATQRRPQCMLSEDIASTGEPGLDDRDDHVDRQILAREIWAAVSELKPEHAELLVLHFANDLSHAEVGRLLKKSEGAVKVSQHRAIRSLHDRVAGSPVLQAWRAGRTGRHMPMRGRERMTVAAGS
jgi:RNA polymerase sigma-70 factor (ECF subfamily)